jgi:hypothetical protein
MESAMYARILISLALLIPIVAKGGWIEIKNSADAIIQVEEDWVDRSKTSGTLWKIQSFEHPVRIGKIAYRSVKTRTEYDCLGQRYRNRSQVYFEQPRAEGRILSSAAFTSPWEPFLAEDPVAQWACQHLKESP